MPITLGFSEWGCPYHCDSDAICQMVVIHACHLNSEIAQVIDSLHSASHFCSDAVIVGN